MKTRNRAGQGASSPFLFRTLRTAALALVLSGLCAVPVLSFTFEPIVQDFAPTGTGSIRSFRLVNTGSDPIAIRISMLTRSMDETGKERNEPADGLFVVYPQRVVLAANSVQAVKIQWTGPAEIASERSFRVLVEQLPVDFGAAQQPGGGLRILFRYLGAIYIVPARAQPAVSLDSVIPAANAAGVAGVEITFSNAGTAHVLMNDLRITLGRKDDPAVKRVFGPEDLAGINGENMLAGSKRRFFLAVPEELRGGDLDVAFQFEAVR